MTVPTATTLHHHDVYDLAYLTGGPHHVADTALVALVQSGRLTVRSTGELVAVTPRRRHPVEAAVMDAVGSASRHSLPTVRWRIARDPRTTAIGARLVGDGLLTGRERRFGTRGRPVPVRSREGRRLLRGLRSNPPADLVAAGTSAMQVALSGIVALEDATLRTQLFAPQRPGSRPGSSPVRRKGGADSSPSYWAGGWGGGGDGGSGGGWGGGDGGCGGGGDGGGGGC